MPNIFLWERHKAAIKEGDKKEMVMKNIFKAATLSTALSLLPTVGNSGSPVQDRDAQELKTIAFEAPSSVNDNKTAYVFNAEGNPTGDKNGNEKAPTPFIKEGHAGDAAAYSGKNKDRYVVIVLVGTQGQEFATQQYAKAAQKIFQSPKYVSNPMDVDVFYKEMDDRSGASFGIYKGGLSIYRFLTLSELTEAAKAITDKEAIGQSTVYNNDLK